MKLQNEWVLVRHGQGENNLKPTLTSPEEGLVIPLTKVGREQAAHFALQDREWDVIISSSYLRAQQTAEIFALAAGVDVLTELDFRELNFGDYVGRPVEDYHEFHAIQPWDFPYPNGDSLKDCGVRAWAAIQKWDQKYEGQRILLVAHALLLRGLDGLLTGESKPGEPNNAEPFPFPEQK